MNMDGEGDRLSSLPDDLIHKIFSSISTKYVVQASALSSRWRFIWTLNPYLNLSIQDFTTEVKFSEFVTRLLSLRNTEIDVSSVKLSFGKKVSWGFVKKIMDYVFSHNIQQRNLSCLILDRGSEFYSLSHDSFPSLEYLSLSNGMNSLRFELPALTTLYLQSVNWSTDYDINSLFSKCANLENLTLERCRYVCSKVFSIFLPRLSNLTHDNCFMGKLVNVDAPKLENLTIRNQQSEVMEEHFIEIYAPGLTSLVYTSYYGSLSLSTDGFNSLKAADIYISQPTNENYGHILNLLKHIHNVKFLTLNMEIIELLSSWVGILRQPFVITNLKRLKIRQQIGFSQGQALNKSIYLDSFPGATLEEIVAQNLIVKLRVLLEQEKTNTKTNMTQMERRKDRTKNHGGKMMKHRKSKVDTKLQIVKKVTAKIQGRLPHLRVQIDERKSKYRLIISELQKIEEVLAMLPAARRALIQPCFASLFAEAVIVMGGITDLMKTRWDQNESRMSFCIQELATTIKRSD